jgi:hypothetical protein
MVGHLFDWGEALVWYALMNKDVCITCFRGTSRDAQTGADLSVMQKICRCAEPRLRSHAETAEKLRAAARGFESTGEAVTSATHWALLSKVVRDTGRTEQSWAAGYVPGLWDDGDTRAPFSWFRACLLHTLVGGTCKFVFFILSFLMSGRNHLGKPARPAAKSRAFQEGQQRRIDAMLRLLSRSFSFGIGGSASVRRVNAVYHAEQMWTNSVAVALFYLPFVIGTSDAFIQDPTLLDQTLDFVETAKHLLEASAAAEYTLNDIAEYDSIYTALVSSAFLVLGRYSDWIMLRPKWFLWAHAPGSLLTDGPFYSNDMGKTVEAAHKEGAAAATSRHFELAQHARTVLQFGRDKLSTALAAGALEEQEELAALAELVAGAAEEEEEQEEAAEDEGAGGVRAAAAAAAASSSSSRRKASAKPEDVLGKLSGVLRPSSVPAVVQQLGDRLSGGSPVWFRRIGPAGVVIPARWVPRFGELRKPVSMRQLLPTKELCLLSAGVVGELDSAWVSETTGGGGAGGAAAGAGSCVTGAVILCFRTWVASAVPDPRIQRLCDKTRSVLMQRADAFVAHRADQVVRKLLAVPYVPGLRHPDAQSGSHASATSTGGKYAVPTEASVLAAKEYFVCSDYPVVP